MKSDFKTFCDIAQQIAEIRSTREKTAVCAAYLQQLESDEHLDLAVRYFGEGAFSTVSGKRAVIGHRTIAVCAAEFLEIDYENVFRPSRIATGSASETIQKLMENLDFARQKRIPDCQLSLSEIHLTYEELAALRKRKEKEALLQEIWRSLSPLEIKYFLRILGGGSLRIGFESRSILNAIALAFETDPETVRFTHMITGSLGKTAILARTQRLDEARFNLHQPVAFMLASPYENRSVDHLSDYVAEEKFDGMRAQLHVSGEEVSIFSRDLNAISDSFPEICTQFADKNLPPTVLDGELCVYLDNTIQPFQLLQKRMGVKKPTAKLLQAYPVAFVAYDVLYSDGKTLFDLPLVQRREILEKVCHENEIFITEQYNIATSDDIDTLFNRAISHGNEGLILKRQDSQYEFGQRKKSWLKVKKPGGSLDTVILYANAGSGKRGGTFSDFTLGIRVSDDDRFEQDFVPIGKAYSGYTDAELKQLNIAIKPLIREKFGPTLSIEPQIVVEIEFDEIQINKRTKAGYTLRLPRFRRIRWDKSAQETDTLIEVERMFAEKLSRERKPQAAFR